MITISDDKLSFMDGTKPWIMKGVKSFPLHGKLMNEGELSTRNVIVNARNLGANLIETLGMVSWYPNFSADNPKYWDALTSLAHITYEEGIQLLITEFADAQILMPDESTQVAHWQRVLTHLGGNFHIFYMLSNQGDKNGLPYSSRVNVGFKKMFPQQLLCRDNPMESSNPTIPPLDWSGFCSARDDVKGFVEVGSSMYYVVNGWGNNLWDGCHQVAVLTEPIGFDEVYSPGRRWADPGKARQLARSLTFRGTGGALFHSQAGTNSEVIDSHFPIQQACAIEFLGNIPNA